MTPVRHDRQSIIDCAVRLLDDVGLPDLSMRRLATHLEVQPSALYWHFDSKQELLAAVADRILRTVPDPDESIPLMHTASSIRDALLAYRDGAEVVLSTYALRLGARRAQDALLASLGGAPEHAHAADAIFEFILGHVMLVQQRMHAHSIGAVAADGSDPTAQSAAVFQTGLRAFESVSARRRPS
ncbi:TetR family transcriptional regulator [Microbacterium sp. MAHUQ-60]|uniref:TetR family transcriptional regulator n=1 Tax=unclassified Microbacterium TaxID=2609290 RepID=UPI00361DA9BB